MKQSFNKIKVVKKSKDKEKLIRNDKNVSVEDDNVTIKYVVTGDDLDMFEMYPSEIAKEKDMPSPPLLPNYGLDWTHHTHPTLLTILTTPYILHT